MAETLNCYVRPEKGTAAVKKLRRQGFIPGIVYGHKTKPISISVAEAEFLKVWQHITGKQVLLNLIIHKKDKEKKEKETRINGFLQDYQHDLVDRKFLHLDFHKVSTAEKIRMAIPVELVGEAPGQKLDGVVDQLLREIEVEGLPGKLPEKITVDISNLNIGDSIYVSQIIMDGEIKILQRAEEPVVSVLAPKKVEEEVAAAPVAEEAEAAVEPEVISEKVAEERRKKKEEEKKE